jgi:hypothetical protein
MKAFMVVSVKTGVHNSKLSLSERVFKVANFVGHVFFVEAKADGVTIENNFVLCVLADVASSGVAHLVVVRTSLGFGNDEVLGPGLGGDEGREW